jgi:hypothetical protein
MCYKLVTSLLCSSHEDMPGATREHRQVATPGGQQTTLSCVTKLLCAARMQLLLRATREHRQVAGPCRCYQAEWVCVADLLHKCYVLRA